MIERASQGENTSIIKIEKPKAFDEVLKQCYKPQNTQSLIATLSHVQKMTQTVNIYHFRSEPTRDAIRVAWETAKPI